MISQTPTDMGYFAWLPPELVNEIINYFPISDINALHQTGKNLNSVVATALFAKTQKDLEQLEAKLFEITDLRIHSNSMNNRYYTLPKNELKKTTKNGSEERCIALRNCVCRIFWDMNLNEIFRIMDLHSSEDPLLLSQIIKSHSSHVQYIKINKTNDKNLILFLKMLGGNQLRVKVLNLCVNPLDDTIVTLFADAIRKNKSLTDLHFEYPLSYPRYLKEPIESIKESEQIVCAKFKAIGEQGWDLIRNKTQNS